MRFLYVKMKFLQQKSPDKEVLQLQKRDFVFYKLWLVSGIKKTIDNELSIANWLVMPNDYSPTYGRSAISLARLIAVVTAL